MGNNPALVLRDSLLTIVKGLIDRERPKPRVCEVYSFNRGTRFAEILLPGETTPAIQARFPAHLQPTRSKMDDGFGTAQGDLVLVEGSQNNYRITQIVEGNPVSMLSRMRAYELLTGGGTITWTTSRYLQWQFNLTTFIGVDQLVTAPVFQIAMPAAGVLVTCHGITGFDTVAVTASGVDMRPDGVLNHSVLFWEPDFTVPTSDAGFFHLVGNSTPFTVPPTWIMVAVMNQVSGLLYMATGRTYPLPADFLPTNLVTLAGAQALTNKDLTGSGNTFPSIPFSMTASGTTDANGFMTVTHNAGFTPVGGWWVSGNPGASFIYFWGIDTITSTTCRLRFANVNTGQLTAAATVAGRLYLVK